MTLVILVTQKWIMVEQQQNCFAFRSAHCKWTDPSKAVVNWYHLWGAQAHAQQGHCQGRLRNRHILKLHSMLHSMPCRDSGLRMSPHPRSSLLNHVLQPTMAYSMSTDDGGTFGSLRKLYPSTSVIRTARTSCANLGRRAAKSRPQEMILPVRSDFYAAPG